MASLQIRCRCDGLVSIHVHKQRLGAQLSALIECATSQSSWYSPRIKCIMFWCVRHVSSSPSECKFSQIENAATLRESCKSSAQDWNIEYLSKALLQPDTERLASRLFSLPWLSRAPMASKRDSLAPIHESTVLCSRAQLAVF